MKVLVLHCRYLSGDVSGENRVVEDEIELLLRHGHEVIAWTPAFRPQRNLLRPALDAVWSRSAAELVRRLLRRERPDVMHVHNLFPVMSPAVLRAAREEGVPVVMTVQNFRLLCLPATLLRRQQICEDCVGKLPWRGFVHGCYRGSRVTSAPMAISLSLHRLANTFECVTTFAPVSRFLRDKLVTGGMASERMVVRPNFAWATGTRRGPGDYFLFLGRLSAEKGLDTVSSVWEGDRRLLVVGDGPDRQRLLAEGRSGVVFRPPLRPAELGQVLRGARALLLPSRWYEGWPRVAVEALAAGVPVIASDIGGLPELVTDGENGLLVRPDDGAAWLDAVRRLCDDAESERLGVGAHRDWRSRFSPEVGLSTLVALYEGTIDTARNLEYTSPEGA